jgi:hypothetical protein
MLCVVDEYAPLRNQYDSNPSRVCARTTPRPMVDLYDSCGTDDCNSVSRFRCRTGRRMGSFAIIVAPMIAMLSHREIIVDPLLRWILFAIIALTAILPTRF